VNGPLRVSGSAAATDVQICPADIVRRHKAAWNGVRADTIELTRREPFEYRFRAPQHLLIMTERASRDDGETLVQGLPKSTQREYSHKLSIVPADHQFYGWQKPRTLTRATYFYIDPHDAVFATADCTTIDFQPRLFFFDSDLWATAAKLKAQAGQHGDCQRLYGDALSMVLLHELARLYRKPAAGKKIFRGGLAGWQQERVGDYVEEHLPEDIALATLAALADLSPFHFARAFRQSFGSPPHRYVMSRRIARAKELLRGPDRSMAEIGFAVGFGNASSFSSVFRKQTGLTPTEFRRAG
jgi:AraC family transcriptional regulator